jgi:hypothetical protein
MPDVRDYRCGALDSKLSKSGFDFVICFECKGVEVYVGDKSRDGFAISDTPQPVLDEVLSASGVELAPLWEE